MAKHDVGEERALADRLVNYSDAIVAISVVGVSGLGLAVADPDTRESIARGADWVLVSNILMGFLFSGILKLLRGWELDLRSDGGTGKKAERYGRHLYRAKLLIIWLAVVQAVGLMWAIR